MAENSLTFLKSANCKIKSSFSYVLEERILKSIRNVYVLKQNTISCLSVIKFMEE